MANSFDKLQELNLSRDEVDRIGEALKKPEFRQLLTDYVEEVQNPENKKLYEEEVIELERERGVDVTFIHPKPGYVIKTSVNGNQKAFVNICVNDHIQKPSSTPTIKEGEKGLTWSLPHSLSPAREDVDNKGARCQVFDVVFNSDTLHLAGKNRAFRNMVNNTALEAVENNLHVQLDKKNLKFPKLSYKGVPHASVIRKPAETQPQHSPEEKEMYDKIFAQLPKNNTSPRKHAKLSRRNSLEDKSIYTSPKYIIKHRSHVDIQEFTEHKDAKMNAATPKELIIEIDLPLLKCSTDIVLDVTEKTVQLTSETPARYKLHLTLPYRVNESTGNAKFDKDLKKLIVTLPVRRCISSIDLSDSGVESDQFSPGTPESEEETIGEKRLVSECEPSELSTQFRTKFLEDTLHYTLPEFLCHVFENVIAFTLNVKNVGEHSVGKIFDSAGSYVHVKFTSIGSSFYPTHYAFCARLPLHTIDAENTTVEVWDNNVVVQVPVICDTPLKSYFYGVNAEDLTERYVEEPEIINQMLQDSRDETVLDENVLNETVQISDENVEQRDNKHNNITATNTPDKLQTQAIDIVNMFYESSGDELSCSSYSPRKSKGILKRLSSKRLAVARSISESSLDELVCSSSFENCHTSLDSVIPEDGEISTSLKKTVRFNDVVTRQLFRSNSSILGQKKKNQRKAKNKKRAIERRHSESEASEGDEKKDEEDEEEEDSKDCEGGEVQHDTVCKKDELDIFHLEVDNEFSSSNH